ncbi:MAG: hypothetical protein AAB225_28640 [Acidobacteriota bacterium]
MSPSGLLTTSWPELAAISSNALKNNDLEALRQLDAAFHHLFLNQVRRGNDASRTEFILGMIAVLESAEAREKPRATELQQLLNKWEHMNILTDAFRRDVDALERASQLIRSREHAGLLLTQVAASGQGIAREELGTRLGISSPHLSKLLRELEACDVIERHPAGRKVFVCLGLVGQLLVERGPGVPAPTAEELETWFPESRILEPLSEQPLRLMARER